MGTLRQGNGSMTGGVPFLAFQSKASSQQSMNPSAVSPALDVSKGNGVAVAFVERGRDEGRTIEWQEGTAYAQDVKSGGGAGSSRHVAHLNQVRRLMPVECERLMGYPDDWTRWGDYGDGKGITEVSDTQRYKMCGNGMAAPVMRWLGHRIALIESMATG